MTNELNRTKDLVFSKLDSANVAIIGERNTGKTTILRKIIEDCVGYANLIVIDTATEHRSKSLAVYCYETLLHDHNAVVIESPELHKLSVNLNPTAFPYDEVKHNRSNIYIIDASKYLEESYFYDDVVKRESIRLWYRVFIRQSLYVLFPLLSAERTVILMDEVELFDDLKSILIMYNRKNIFCINAVHSLKSLGDCSEQFYVMSLQRVLKPANMICGSACVWYFINIICKINCDITKKLLWIPEIALYLYEKGYCVSLYCYQSSLYEAYIMDENIKSEGISVIRNYISVIGEITIRPFDIDIMKSEIDEGYILIVQVDSMVFNNDASISSNGHYILLIGYTDFYVQIVNPKSECFISDKLHYNRLSSAMSKSGNWCLKVRPCR